MAGGCESSSWQLRGHVGVPCQNAASTSTLLGSSRCILMRSGPLSPESRHTSRWRLLWRCFASPCALRCNEGVQPRLRFAKLPRLPASINTQIKISRPGSNHLITTPAPYVNAGVFTVWPLDPFQSEVKAIGLMAYCLDPLNLHLFPFLLFLCGYRHGAFESAT